MAQPQRDPARSLLVFIGVVSTAIALVLLGYPDAFWSRPDGAWAAQGTPEGPAAIVAVPVQLRAGYEALAIIDKENYTICLYQYQVTRPVHERLVLLAARSFRYDRQLQDYNTADPRPTEVKDLLRQGLPGEPPKPTPPPDEEPQPNQ